MHNAIAIIAGCLTVFAAVPYIVDIIKGKTNPNVVTWFTWSLLNIIYLATAWSTGAIQTSIFAAAGLIATGTICIAGLRQGIKRYTKFDIVCQVVALAGIALWLLTKNPNIAVIINLGVDFAGLLPTYRHACKAPYAETWQAFAVTGFAAVLTLLSIQHYTFVAIASPLYILCANSALVITILLLRKKKLPHSLQA